MRPKWAPKIIPITFVLFGGSTRNYQDTAPGSAQLGATRNMKIIFKLLQHCPLPMEVRETYERPVPASEIIIIYMVFF